MTDPVDSHQPPQSQAQPAFLCVSLNPAIDKRLKLDTLKTGRVMVKDEDVCLHCGLCAERCPTGAWDMQRFLYNPAHAEHVCCKR